jgi:PAS domain S-box-containing protein
MGLDGMIAVVDALYQPALLLDGTGRVRHANAAAAARFALQAGQACRDALHCDPTTSAPCPLADVLATRGPRTCLFEREGVRFGLRLAAVGPDLLLATLAEATPIERLPGDDQDLLQTILDSSSDVFIACNRDHVIEFVNRALVERAGVPAAALVGRNFRDVWKPFVGIPWEELEERVLQRGEVFRLNDVEYRHGLGGTPVWMNLTFSPRRDAAGAIVGSVTTVNYLTEQRRLQLELAESERGYRALFDGAPVGLVIIGTDGRLRLSNATMRNTVGGARDETGHQVGEFIASEDRERMLAGFQRAVATGRPRPEGVDFALVGPDGERRQMHVRMSEITYQGERAMLAAMLDVTEVRRLQEQLTRAERLAGLGGLAAGVAHEFNNVLAAIQGRAEIIGRSAPAAGSLAGECARAIVRHSRRGAEIIQQINSLVATRPTRPVALRWEDVLEDVLASLGPRLAEERIVLERDYAARRAVNADPGQVHQLVLNLLQNARDAIRPLGAGTIRVATREVPEGVALEIGDTGVGMDELTRQRLFEPFFSTKGGGERRSDLGTGLGLGLGLAIVHSVVRAHQGRVDVSSTPGQGTRLTVVFPAALEPAEFGRSVPVTLDAAPRTLRVTVVDDDVDVTEMVALALTTRGCKALEVNDGRRAVEACVEVEADVILIDRLMPPVDGLDVLREVRRRGVQTPAVLLSGRRADEDPDVLRALGVRRRLEKPVGLADLFAAIDDACGGPEGGNARFGAGPDGSGGAPPGRAR